MTDAGAVDPIDSYYCTGSTPSNIASPWYPADPAVT